MLSIRELITCGESTKTEKIRVNLAIKIIDFVFRFGSNI
jgi:hypothetical protein